MLQRLIPPFTALVIDFSLRDGIPAPAVSTNITTTYPDYLKQGLKHNNSWLVRRYGKAAELRVCLDFLLLLRQGKRRGEAITSKRLESFRITCFRISSKKIWSFKFSLLYLCTSSLPITYQERLREMARRSLDNLSQSYWDKVPTPSRRNCRDR